MCLCGCIAIFSAGATDLLQVEDLHFELEVLLLQREATIRYVAPIHGDPLCRCSVPLEQLEGFRNTLTSHGKARLDTDIDLLDGESIAAVLSAGYSARSRL